MKRKTKEQLGVLDVNSSEFRIRGALLELLSEHGSFISNPITPRSRQIVGASFLASLAIAKTDVSKPDGRALLPLERELILAAAHRELFAAVFNDNVR
jgi:hypothetical protein